MWSPAVVGRMIKPCSGDMQPRATVPYTFLSTAGFFAEKASTSILYSLFSIMISPFDNAPHLGYNHNGYTGSCLEDFCYVAFSTWIGHCALDDTCH